MHDSKLVFLLKESLTVKTYGPGGKRRVNSLRLIVPDPFTIGKLFKNRNKCIIATSTGLVRFLQHFFKNLHTVQDLMGESVLNTAPRSKFYNTTSYEFEIITFSKRGSSWSVLFNNNERSLISLGQYNRKTNKNHIMLVGNRKYWSDKDNIDNPNIINVEELFK